MLKLKTLTLKLETLKLKLLKLKVWKLKLLKLKTLSSHLVASEQLDGGGHLGSLGQHFVIVAGGGRGQRSRPTVGIWGGDGDDLRDVEGGARRRLQRLLGGSLGLVQEDASLPLQNLRGTRQKDE